MNCKRAPEVPATKEAVREEHLAVWEEHFSDEYGIPYWWNSHSLQHARGGGARNTPEGKGKGSNGINAEGNPHSTATTRQRAHHPKANRAIVLCCIRSSSMKRLLKEIRMFCRLTIKSGWCWHAHLMTYERDCSCRVVDTPFWFAFHIVVLPSMGVSLIQPHRGLSTAESIMPYCFMVMGCSGSLAASPMGPLSQVDEP